MLLDQARAVYGDRLNARAIQFEHLLALHRRGGVVHVHDGARRALKGIEGARDEFRPRLGQHLNAHVGRDEVVLDQVAQKIEVVARRRGKAHFDFLKTELHQQAPQAQLLRGVHRLDQGLIAIAKIDAAPPRRPLDLPIRPAAGRQGHGLEGCVATVIEAAACLVVAVLVIAGVVGWHGVNRHWAVSWG